MSIFETTIINDAAGNGPVAVKPTGAAAAPTDPSLVVALSPNSAIATQQYSDAFPTPINYPTGAAALLNQDVDGNLMIRGPVLSDEESYRSDFSGSSLVTNLTGTVTFTTGLDIVTGSGTSFLTQVAGDGYVKLSTDANDKFVKVASVDSNTQITLMSTYAGSSGAGTGQFAEWISYTDSGTSVTVSSSSVNLIGDGVNGHIVSIYRDGDYLPMVFNTYASVSARNANQEVVFGFQDQVDAAVTQQAVVVFSGTSNTTAIFRTSSGSAASDIQETTFTLPNTAVSSTVLYYELDVGPDRCSLSVNGVLMAAHSQHIPEPYTVMKLVGYVKNTGATSTATLSIDMVFFQNVNDISVSSPYKAQPLAVQSTTPNITASGSLGALNAAASISAGSGGALGVNVSGTWQGTITFEGTVDGTTWVSIRGVPLYGGAATTTTSSNGTWVLIGGGMNQFRTRMSAYTSGTAVVSMVSTIGAQVQRVFNTDYANLLTTTRLTSSDAFDQIITSQRIPQIALSFINQVPSTSMTVTTANGGASNNTSPLANGANFSTSTAINGSVKAVSFGTVLYSQHYEIYCAYTCIFTAGVANSYQRGGLYDTNNGFSFGYNGSTFGLWSRIGAADTFVAQTAWNVDTCGGALTSKFTRNGVPEALVPTWMNFYRVRFGWLGIAPVVFEVLTPDGQFIPVHILRYPNSQAAFSVSTPFLPVTFEAANTGSNTNKVMSIGCIIAGATMGASPTNTITSSLAASNAQVIIPAGYGSGFGVTVTGTFSGTLAFESSIDGGISWTAIHVLPLAGGTVVTTATAAGSWIGPGGGVALIRVRFSSYTSGTAVVTLLLTSGTRAIRVFNTSADNMLVTSTPTKSSTSSLTSVSSSATSVTVLAANTSRLAATIFNDSNQTLYAKCGATASTTSFTVKITAGGYWEVPANYTGIIDGIWSSANGSARVTEFTA